MSNSKNISKEDLEKYYVDQWLSTMKIAKIFSCKCSTIRNYLIKYNIPRRTLSESHLGQIAWNKDTKGIMISWNKGLEFSEETKQKQSESAKKRFSNPEEREKAADRYYSLTEKQKQERSQKLSKSHLGQIPGNKGMKMSEEFCQHVSEAQKALGRTGEKSSNWQGGITPKNMKIRGSFEYRQWRTSVFKRDQYLCHRCNSKGYLHAHHIINFSDVMNDENKLWDTNNGITFCRNCHKQFHLKYGKFNNNQQQIFEFVYLNN